MVARDNQSTCDRECGGELQMYHSVPDTILEAEKCPKEREVVDTASGEIFLVRCNSGSCTFEGCRLAFARRHSLILQDVASRRPIAFYATMKFTGSVRPLHDEFKQKWRQVMQALAYQRRKNRKVDADWSFDVRCHVDTPHDDVDFNFVVWTTAFGTWQQAKAFLRPILAMKFDGFDFRLYLDKPDTQVGVCKYGAGDVRDTTKRGMPRWDWKGRRLVFGSRRPFGGRT